MEQKKPYSLGKLTDYVGNNKNDIIEMITVFIDTIPPEINKLSTFANANDWDNVQKIAHKFKASFDVFSMYDILAEIKDIEFLAQNNNIDGSLGLLIDNFLKKFNYIILLLKAEVKSL